jgi:transposase-like protein
MARPYSLDLRERAVARVEAGESVRFVARGLNIGPSRVVKWSRQFKATGSQLRGRWAATGRAFLLVSMPPFLGSASRKAASPCAPWWQSLPAEASKWTTGRFGPSFIVQA